MEYKQISFFDVVLVLLKHRKFILKYVTIITIFALIISLLWPKSYKSTVKFFPPPSEQLGFSGLLGNIFQSTPSTSKLSSEALLIIINSRTLKEKVIHKFNLADVYNIRIPEHLIKKFESNINISESREGGLGFNPIVSMEFSFIDEDPKRAEAITSYYVEALDSMLKAFNYDRMNNTYETMHKRYMENLQDIETAEEEFEKFQEQYGIFEIETQLKSAIQNMAELKAQSVELDIQISFLKNNYSGDNTQIKQLISKKRELDAKYNELIEATGGGDQDKLFHPFSKMPELMRTYAQLFREVTIQNKIYEVILPQYEQIKMEIESEQFGIQILDHAKLPTYKDKPKRALIVVAGFIFSLILTTIIIYIKEYFNKLESTDSPEYSKWIHMKNTIKSDFTILKKNRD
jgi:uncharacterized protein involved in exopolysaccharide biosynthesis